MRNFFIAAGFIMVIASMLQIEQDIDAVLLRKLNDK